MIPSAEAQARRNEYRRRAALPPGHPEEMTLQDWKEAILLLREDRFAAQSSGEKVKAAKPAQVAEALLKDW